jgi:hypothetical protein
MNSISNDMALVIKSVILLIMFCEWAFLYFWFPSLLRESGNSNAKLVLRPLVALGMIAVVWLQGRLYNGTFTSQAASHEEFLTDVFLLQHVVSLLIIFRAAFKIRSEQQKTGQGQTPKT